MGGEAFDVQTMEWIKKHALEANGLQAVQQPQDPAYISRYYDRNKGAVIEVTARPHPREYRASSLGALAGLVGRHFATRKMHPGPGIPPAGVPVGDTIGGDAGERCTVFVGDDSVVAVLDETGDRRESFMWTLNHSEAWEELGRVNKKAMNQRDFLRFLRYTAREDTDPKTLTATVRQLRFMVNTHGTQGIQAGRESLGKTVEMEVAGIDASALPDMIVLRMPVYDELLQESGANVGQVKRFPVMAALETDMAAQTFTLRVLDGELPNTLLRAQSDIMAGLIEAMKELVDSGAVHVTLGSCET